MSKEQIKIICDDARTITDNDHKVIRCHINIKYFNWLIDQARELENLKDAFDDLDSDYIDLHQENKRYRDSLEFYGNKENYLHELSRLKATNYSKVMDDYGEIARKALRSD